MNNFSTWKGVWLGVLCKHGHDHGGGRSYRTDRGCCECETGRVKTYPVDPARKAAWKVKNREHVRKTDAEYRQRNRDAIVAYNARYREANPQWLKAYYNAYNARRRAAECRATPAWADQKKIAEIYETAVTLTLSTGIEHDVDHIVPLRSKRVCGLHVEHNLRPFPSRSNAQKGNRWWPDGPDDISLPASYDAHALR